MRCYATSDLHGSLPEVPTCDLLLIAGDICPNDSHNLDYQLAWLETVFASWLRKVPAKRIVGIAGNHDFVFDRAPREVDRLRLDWTYLEDEMTLVDGLRIYGTPWVPNLPRWAFHGGTDNRVQPATIDAIPEGVDVLMSHGPMHGYGDKIHDHFVGPFSVGDKTMAAAMPRLKPKAFVCGHIHEGHGHYRHDDIEHGVFNVAHNNVHYEPVHPPVEIPV